MRRFRVGLAQINSTVGDLEGNIARIRAGLEVTGPCAADIGRDVQEVIAAALHASATGRRVRLPLGDDRAISI